MLCGGEGWNIDGATLRKVSLVNKRQERHLATILTDSWPTCNALKLLASGRVLLLSKNQNIVKFKFSEK